MSTDDIGLKEGDEGHADGTSQQLSQEAFSAYGQIVELSEFNNDADVTPTHVIRERIADVFLPQSKAGLQMDLVTGLTVTLPIDVDTLERYEKTGR